MHLPLPRASGNKNTPATVRNPLGIINRNLKRQQNQKPAQPQPLGKGNKEQKLPVGPLRQLRLGVWGEGLPPPCLLPGPPKWAAGCRHHRSGRGVSKDGYLAPMAPFREGTVTPSTYHSSFHGCRRQPHVPPLGTGTRWGAWALSRVVSSLSLGKIYNFYFFFFLIFIFIYIDIYIYTHLVTRKEKKNRIRNNNNKKKYSGLKTIHSYHARRAGDCTRPTCGWRSRGSAGAAASPRALPEPPAGVCLPRRDRGRSRGPRLALPGVHKPLASARPWGPPGRRGGCGGSAPHTEIS